jgi:hypothetical protein
MAKVGIDELAERLIRNGSQDNEADARLAALTIILVLDDLAVDTGEAAASRAENQ